MSRKLEGKVALITGGSSGLGLATARRFVDEGAHVFIVARRRQQLESAVAEIGRNATALQADVTSIPDLERVFDDVKEQKGVIDVIVTSAGLTEQKTIEDVTPEHFDKTFDLNVRGTFFTIQKGLPLMTRGGSIVLVSSGMHLKGFPAHVVYTATKAAVRSMARVMAGELKDRNIRVNSLSPGAIDTPILASQFPTTEGLEQFKAFFAGITPLGRIGRPEEIAAAALYLASAESSYSTGIDLVADGGITQL